MSDFPTEKRRDPGIKRQYYALPENPEPTGTICVQLYIPDEVTHKRAFIGALMTLTYWFNWQRDPMRNGIKAANMWKDAVMTLNWGCTDMAACLPVGAIVAFPTPLDADSGWLLCDGTWYDKVDYPELWQFMVDANVAGESWGVNETQVRTPPLTAYQSLVQADGSTVTGGLYGGEAEHTLTTAEMPPHKHKIPGYVSNNLAAGTYTRSSFVVEDDAVWNNDALSGEAGGGDPHNNMPPWTAIYYHINARSCGAQTDLEDSLFKLRQSETDPCVLEQTQNNGYTWEEAFDYSLCSAINRGTEITYETNITVIIGIYDGTAGSIAPNMTNNDAYRNTAICFALRQLVAVVMATAKKRKEGETKRNALFALALGVTGLVLGLITAGVGLLIAGAVGAAVFGISAAVINDLDVDDYDDEDAQADVACCANDAMTGQTPTESLFENAWDACGFTAGSTQAKMAAIMQEVATDLDTYLAFLKLANEAYDLAERGLIGCECGLTESLLETFNVYGHDSGYTTGSVNTTDGALLRVEVTGDVRRYALNNSWLSDAQYDTSNNWSSYSRYNRTQFNDGSRPEATDSTYNSGHVYNFTRLGDGNPVSLRFYDSNYTDNPTGDYWTVKVYQWS